MSEICKNFLSSKANFNHLKDFIVFSYYRNLQMQKRKNKSQNFFAQILMG